MEDNAPPTRWLLIISLLVFSLFLSLESEVTSELKRDEETAQEVQKINPLTPAAKATGKVLDTTIHKALPFDVVPTESQLTRQETDCYRACEQERDDLLKKAVTDVERGYAWVRLRECKGKCPEQAASKTEGEQRAPAGSTLEYIKSRP